jgi:hypothetical protein
MPVSNLTIETLKEINIWDELDEKMQAKLIQEEESLKSQKKERMEKARKGRKQKYPHIPRELQCTTCPAKIPTPPGTTSKRVEKLGITLDDYLKQYQCQKCKPTRGRPRKNK